MNVKLILAIVGVVVIVFLAYVFSDNPPKYEVLGEARETPDHGDLRLLSYNVKGLFNPNKIQTLLNFLEKNMDVDVIVLQEVWFRGRKKALDKFFLSHGWTVCRQGNVLRGSGLYTACRYNVALIKGITFPWHLGMDALELKGALGVRVCMRGKSYSVVNTHLQDYTWDAAGEVRKKQLQTAYSVFGAAIYVGDFNIDVATDQDIVPSSMGKLCFPQSPTLGNKTIDGCIHPFTCNTCSVSVDNQIDYSDHYPITIVVS